jgi:cytochrome c556
MPVAIAAVAVLAPAAETAVPDSPDAIDPAEIIAARQALMLASESLMQPIDTYTVDDSIDPESMRANASAIAAMLLAVPELFPDSTNLYDPDVDLPETLALPSVWESFQSFYSLASTAAAAATKLSETFDTSDLGDASLRLRGACDACHAVYLLPYEPAEIEPADDIDFDFGN